MTETTIQQSSIYPGAIKSTITSQTAVSTPNNGVQSNIISPTASTDNQRNKHYKDDDSDDNEYDDDYDDDDDDDDDYDASITSSLFEMQQKYQRIGSKNKKYTKSGDSVISFSSSASDDTSGASASTSSSYSRLSRASSYSSANSKQYDDSRKSISQKPYTFLKSYKTETNDSNHAATTGSPIENAHDNVSNSSRKLGQQQSSMASTSHDTKNCDVNDKQSGALLPLNQDFIQEKKTTTNGFDNSTSIGSTEKEKSFVIPANHVAISDTKLDRVSSTTGSSPETAGDNGTEAQQEVGQRTPPIPPITPAWRRRGILLREKIVKEDEQDQQKVTESETSRSVTGDKSTVANPSVYQDCANDADGVSLLQNDTPIEQYFTVANKVYEQFLHHPIDTKEELLQSYLIGKRLCRFITQILPTHPQYRTLCVSSDERENSKESSTNTNATKQHQQQQQHFRTLQKYLLQIELLIDENEHEDYIRSVIVPGNGTNGGGRNFDDTIATSVKKHNDDNTSYNNNEMNTTMSTRSTIATVTMDETNSVRRWTKVKDPSSPDRQDSRNDTTLKRANLKEPIVDKGISVSSSGELSPKEEHDKENSRSSAFLVLEETYDNYDHELSQVLDDNRRRRHNRPKQQLREDDNGCNNSGSETESMQSDSCSISFKESIDVLLDETPSPTYNDRQQRYCSNKSEFLHEDARSTPTKTILRFSTTPRDDDDETEDTSQHHEATKKKASSKDINNNLGVLESYYLNPAVWFDCTTGVAASPIVHPMLCSQTPIGVSTGSCGANDDDNNDQKKNYKKTNTDTGIYFNDYDDTTTITTKLTGDDDDNNTIGSKKPFYVYNANASSDDDDTDEGEDSDYADDEDLPILGEKYQLSKRRRKYHDRMQAYTNKNRSSSKNKQNTKNNLKSESCNEIRRRRTFINGNYLPPTAVKSNGERAGSNHNTKTKLTPTTTSNGPNMSSNEKPPPIAMVRTFSSSKNNSRSERDENIFTQISFEDPVRGQSPVVDEFDEAEQEIFQAITTKTTKPSLASSSSSAIHRQFGLLDDEQHAPLKDCYNDESTTITADGSSVVKVQYHHVDDVHWLSRKLSDIELCDVEARSSNNDNAEYLQNRNDIAINVINTKDASESTLLRRSRSLSFPRSDKTLVDSDLFDETGLPDVYSPPQSDRNDWDCGNSRSTANIDAWTMFQTETSFEETLDCVDDDIDISGHGRQQLIGQIKGQAKVRHVTESSSTNSCLIDVARSRSFEESRISLTASQASDVVTGNHQQKGHNGMIKRVASSSSLLIPMQSNHTAEGDSVIVNPLLRPTSVGVKSNISKSAPKDMRNVASRTHESLPVDLDCSLKDEEDVVVVAANRHSSSSVDCSSNESLTGEKILSTDLEKTPGKHRSKWINSNAYCNAAAVVENYNLKKDTNVSDNDSDDDSFELELYAPISVPGESKGAPIVEKVDNSPLGSPEITYELTVTSPLSPVQFRNVVSLEAEADRNCRDLDWSSPETAIDRRDDDSCKQIPFTSMEPNNLLPQKSNHSDSSSLNYSHSVGSKKSLSTAAFLNASQSNRRNVNKPNIFSRISQSSKAFNAPGKLQPCPKDVGRSRRSMAIEHNRNKLHSGDTLVNSVASSLSQSHGIHNDGPFQAISNAYQCAILQEGSIDTYMLSFGSSAPQVVTCRNNTDTMTDQFVMINNSISNSNHSRTNKKNYNYGEIDSKKYDIVRIVDDPKYFDRSSHGTTSSNTTSDHYNFMSPSSFEYDKKLAKLRKDEQITLNESTDDCNTLLLRGDMNYSATGTSNDDKNNNNDNSMNNSNKQGYILGCVRGLLS